MRGNELLDKMELVDSAYVEAADCAGSAEKASANDASSEEHTMVTGSGAGSRNRNRNNWIRRGAVAACLVIAAGAALSIHFGQVQEQGSGEQNKGGIMEDNYQSMSDNTYADTEEGTQEAETTVHVSMNDIFVNEIENVADSALRYYDPELYDKVIWNTEDIVNYYGSDLTPPYVPEGLIPSPGNEKDQVIVKKDGTVENDTVWLEYYHDYYEDGSPMNTEGVVANKGFTLMVSKLGIVNDCLYILPENEVQVSDVGGTSVTIGYRMMPYGPYDEETHEPSGYYDLYVAEFEFEGRDYQLVAAQMELEEVVKVVSSIIFGESAVEVDE